MARIKDDSVERVKQAADLVELVSARTQVRKAGSRFTARCPFHEERTPSFSINPVEKWYYCFGCGAKGDVITFVRETESLDFAGAIEWLGERFRIPLEYDDTSPKQDAERRHRDRLYALLEQATAFYERHLWETEAGEPVRAYLAGRGLGEEVCREFRLGLSPGGATLARKAAEKGFTRAELASVGLVNRRGNDYFAGRLMFPMADARGRVVGFSARKLREDDPLRGKYVNSPEGELFHKSAILYGLHLARGAIAKQERAVVVEGNTDAIALRQAGLEPTVASMGTALTERQLKELTRLTSRLYLCFDSDAAGEAATLRGMDLARRNGFHVLVVALPKGSDPADDPAGFQARLDEAASYPLHGVRVICAGSGSAEDKFRAAREFLAPIEESPERQDALRFVADQLGLSRDTQAGLAPRAGGAAVGISERVLEVGDRLERDALAAVVRHRKLVPLLAELSPDDFNSEEHRQLRAHLVEGVGANGLTGLLAELDARATEEDVSEVTAKELLLRLRERRLQRDLSRATEDLERTRELQASLARVRAALRDLV